MKVPEINMAGEDATMKDLDSQSQWLVERARQSLRENNPYEAKAWLITAKTLYPKDFGIQVGSELAIKCLFVCNFLHLLSSFHFSLCFCRLAVSMVSTCRIIPVFK